jgi:hypothetical protein
VLAFAASKDTKEERRMPKKLILVLSLTVVLVGVFAAVAVAEGELIQCKKSVPCYGGKGEDKILERIGNRKDDQIVPKGADDLVLANKYTNDTDVVRGGGGRDKINVADGDKRDRANGGAGRDWCIVDARKEVGPSCFRVTVR